MHDLGTLLFAAENTTQSCEYYIRWSACVCVSPHFFVLCRTDACGTPMIQFELLHTPSSSLRRPWSKAARTLSRKSYLPEDLFVDPNVKPRLVQQREKEL